MTPGRHVLEAVSLAGRLLPGSCPDSGTSSDILLKPNVASSVSGEVRYGSELAIMKRAPPPQTGGGDHMKPSTPVTVHRAQRGCREGGFCGSEGRYGAMCRRLHAGIQGAVSNCKPRCPIRVETEEDPIQFAEKVQGEVRLVMTCHVNTMVVPKAY